MPYVSQGSCVLLVGRVLRSYATSVYQVNASPVKLVSSLGAREAQIPVQTVQTSRSGLLIATCIRMGMSMTDRGAL